MDAGTGQRLRSVPAPYIGGTSEVAFNPLGKCTLGNFKGRAFSSTHGIYCCRNLAIEAALQKFHYLEKDLWQCNYGGYMSSLMMICCFYIFSLGKFIMPAPCSRSNLHCATSGYYTVGAFLAERVPIDGSFHWPRFDV